MKKSTKKIENLLYVLITTIVILIVVIVADNTKIDYGNKKNSITCDERKETNKFLIKSCRDSGNEVKITYFKDGKTVQSISCGSYAK